MRPGSRICIGLCIVGLFCGAGRNAEAAVITGIGQFILPGASTGSLSFSPAVAPNNDNATAASPNTISTGLGPFLNAGGFGILDYEFVVAESGGTTEYAFTTNVINNTGVAWNDFHFELGFGTGDSFVAVASGAALDFDTPDRDPAPASSVFPTLDASSNRLDWSGATVNYLGGGAGPFSSAFTLSFDVPDGIAALNPQGLNRFTLRSYPTATPVPEPTTSALLVAGLAILASRRRARNARRPGDR
ncbi:hypothetical protein TBR22_A41880 [Luteitalea sp. TBR-22]|uniref:PEP-CTERM sorting domain-containing protein n=1 Tax=Luteitalea sp. TBR-22 TaxID=2802971 RepID=UPI001AF4EEB7|nr:PEP-CTERM sorting domain-containing protein [Luteitalea sp. TBR-22]BCS34962.1 hypothetical protein TBR22_A41880 [Luteitalea sp. TBR-22]